MTANRVLRVSLRKINKLDKDREKRTWPGYTALLAEDNSKNDFAENELKNYTFQFEKEIQTRVTQLEKLNNKLVKELTELKKDKAALQASEQRYSKLFHQSLSGICLLEKGHIIDFNNQFSEIFHYPDEFLKTMSLSDLFYDKDKIHIDALFSELEGSRTATKPITARAKNRVGNIIWLAVRLDYIVIENKNNIIVNVIDISRQKSVEFSLRKSEQRLQQLSRQLLSAQEVERKRLAQELHDGLLQSLSTIKYSIENTMNNFTATALDDNKRKLAALVETIQDSIDEARRMAMDLRPSVLDDLGIVYTINWFCKKFRKTYSHIKIVKKIDIDENEISDDRKIAIYRILQEALYNVAKHSGADTVHVALTRMAKGFIQLSISDNGCGISDLAKPLMSIDSMGLSGMLERVELTTGMFMISDNIPGGVTIDVCWPVEVVSGS